MKNIVKKIIPSAITLFMLTSAPIHSAQVGSSETGVWSGNSGTIEDQCEFKKNRSGSMSLNGTTWNITTPVEMQIKTRGVDSVTVTTDGKLRNPNGEVVEDVDVNYNGSTVTGGPAGMTETVNNDSITVRNIKSDGASVFTINISGTARMESTDNIATNTVYTITHLVTCLQ